MNEFDRLAQQILLEYPITKELDKVGMKYRYNDNDDKSDEFISDAEYLDSLPKLSDGEIEVGEPIGTPGTTGEYEVQVLQIDVNGHETAVVDCRFDLKDNLMSCMPTDGWGESESHDTFADKLTRMIQHRTAE